MHGNECSRIDFGDGGQSEVSSVEVTGRSRSADKVRAASATPSRVSRGKRRLTRAEIKLQYTTLGVRLNALLPRDYARESGDEWEHRRFRFMGSFTR